MPCKKGGQGSPRRSKITRGEGWVTPWISLSHQGPTQTDKQPSELTPADDLVATLANVSLAPCKPYKVRTSRTRKNKSCCDCGCSCVLIFWRRHWLPCRKGSDRAALMCHTSFRCLPRPHHPKLLLQSLWGPTVEWLSLTV